MFARMFLGYVVQVLPFALLALFPFAGDLRWSTRKTAATAVLLVLALAAVFAGSCCYIEATAATLLDAWTLTSVVFLATLVPCAVAYVFVIHQPWQKTLFALGFALTSALAVTAICNMALRLPLFSRQSDGWPYRPEGLVVLIVATAISLPLLLWVLRRFYRSIADELTSQESVSLSLLSVALFVVLAASLAFMDYAALDASQALVLIVMLVVAVFAVYAIFLRGLDLALRNARERQVAERERSLAALQREQYRRILGGAEGTRRMHHDIRHHLVTLSGLLANDSDEGAQRYIEECLNDLQRYEVARVCANEAANAVVGHYQQAAEDVGVELTTMVRITDGLAVRDTDLAVILGNLLENALRAAADAPQGRRFVRLGMASSGRMLAITVDNGFVGALRQEGGTYLSTKDGHEGIGLASVASVAARYGGTVEFAHDSGMFHASVMLACGE